MIWSLLFILCFIICWPLAIAWIVVACIRQIVVEYLN